MEWYSYPRNPAFLLSGSITHGVPRRPSGVVFLPQKPCFPTFRQHNMWSTQRTQWSGIPTPETLLSYFQAAQHVEYPEDPVEWYSYPRNPAFLLSGSTTHGVPRGPSGVVFLPQKPYFTDGTLREQIIYPHLVMTYSREYRS